MKWIHNLLKGASLCRVSIPFKKNQQGPYLRFEDPENHFAAKDTSLADLRDRVIEIGLKDAE